MLIFLQKNAENSKNKRGFVLKQIFFKIEYVCLLTYQISSFSHNSNEFYTRGSFALSLPSPTLRELTKNPTQIRFKKML